MLKRIASDAFVYGIGIVASRFAYILLLPLYLRWFSLAEYGLLELLLTTGSILLLVCDLQIVSGVLREYYEARASGSSRGLLGTALTLYLINTSAWVAVGCLVFARWGNLLGGTIHWIHVIPLLAVILPSQLMTLCQVVLRLESRKYAFIIFSFLDLSTSALLSVIFVQRMHWGIAGVLWGMAVSKIVWVTVVVGMLRKSFGLRPELALAKRILKYGIPMVPGSLAQWAQSYSSRFLLAALLTLSDVALFSLAARLTSLIALVDLAFRQAWEPHVMRLFGVRDSEPTISRVYKAYLFGMFAVCTTVAFIGPCAVGIFAGRRYGPSTPLFGFLAYASLWNGSAGILSSGNSWERKTYWNGLGVLIGVIVNIAIVLFSARHLGLFGVGVATLVGSMCAVGVTFVTAQRNHPIPFRLRSIGMAAGASIVLAFFSYAIHASRWFHTLTSFEQIGLSVAIVGIVLPCFFVLGGGMDRYRTSGGIPGGGAWLLRSVLSVVRK